MLWYKIFYVKGRAGPETSKVVGVSTLSKLTVKHIPCIGIVITTKALHCDK